jgi:hypothetical protein
MRGVSLGVSSSSYVRTTCSLKNLRSTSPPAEGAEASRFISMRC